MVIITEADLIDWYSLKFKLRYIEVRLLKIIYEEKTIAFPILSKKVSEYRYSEKTLRRKIDLLENLGLIDTHKGAVLMIRSKQSLERHVPLFCSVWYMEDRRVRS